MIKILSDVEQQLVDKMLVECPEMIWEEPEKLRGYECRIRWKNDTPIIGRPYLIPLAKPASVEMELKRMLALRVI